MEIPDDLANLFYGLTGTKWPKVDEDRLRNMSDAYATVEYILATELPDLIVVLRRKVQSTFDSRTTEYFENSLAQFTAGERDYVGESAKLAGEIRQYAKDAANQVEYAKWMIIGQLIQLALEIAWAIATAKFTFGASLKMIPVFKFIKSVVIRRILNSLLWNLLSHLFIAQMFGVTMDLLIQRIQMDQGNREEWDKELTRMAAAGAFVEGLLSAGLSFGADLFLSGRLGKLFGDNLPDPPTPPPPVRDIVPDPPAGPAVRGPDPDSIATPTPRDTPDASPTPPPRDQPGDGPEGPPGHVPQPPGSITPEFNRDLVNLFARNSNEFLGAAQRPNTASVGMDHARRFVDRSGDMFAKHFGETIGDAAARNLGREYAETMLRTWNTPRMTSSLDDVLGSAPLPQSTRDHLARDVPEAFGRTVADFGSRWRDRAMSLGIGAASGAFEGYVGEGLTNLWFSPEQEWKASGMSAVAGASSSVVHDLAVSGGLKGIDALNGLRDLNNLPAPEFGGAGPGADPERGGDRGPEPDFRPSRLRGGGESLSSFESDGGGGDDSTAIGLSGHPGGEDGAGGEESSRGGEAPSRPEEEASESGEEASEGGESAPRGGEEPRQGDAEPSRGGEASQGGQGSETRSGEDENSGRREAEAPRAGTGSDPVGRGGEHSAARSGDTSGSDGDGRERSDAQPAPAPEPGHEDAFTGDTTTGDTTGGEPTHEAEPAPPTTVVEPPPAAQETGEEHSGQAPRGDLERSEAEAETITSPTGPEHGEPEGFEEHTPQAPSSPSPEGESRGGERRDTFTEADPEGEFPTSNEGIGRSEPHGSEAGGIAGEFFRSLNGDLQESGTEGAPVPPPMVAAPVPQPSGSGPATGPASSSSSGRQEGTGSGPSREGVYEAGQRDGFESPTDEGVSAPSDPPEVVDGPVDTETVGTSREAEHTSHETPTPRTESTIVPPAPAPVTPVAEPPSFGRERPEGHVANRSTPPTRQGGDPLTPIREEQDEGGVESSPVDPDGDPIGQEETATPDPTAETRGKRKEEPPTDGVEGDVVGGEDTPVPHRGEGLDDDDVKAPVGDGAPPRSDEPAESSASDIHAVGTPPPVASPHRKNGSETGSPRPSNPVRDRDPLRNSDDRAQEPLPPTDPVVEETPGTSVPPVAESEVSGAEGSSTGGPETREPRTREPKGKEPEARAPDPEESRPQTPPATEPETARTEQPPTPETRTREPKGKEPETRTPDPDPPADPAEESGTEESESAEPVIREPKGKGRATEETDSETDGPPLPITPEAPEAPEAPENTVPQVTPPVGPPAVADPSRTGGADGPRLNYLIESRWIEAYGVRVDPEAVLATFSGSPLPDDVRVFFRGHLATDPRGFFSPEGVRKTSSDGRTYTLRLSTENVWSRDERPRPGAPTANYKGLHDEQTQTSTGESGFIGKTRQPAVGVHANLFHVEAAPAPSFGGKVSGYRGSSVQQQSGATNHTQQLSTEMTGEGQPYTSDLTVTWRVEGDPDPVASTPGSDGATGPETSGDPPPTTTATEGVDGIELGTLSNPPPVIPTEGDDGTEQDTSGNPAPATTTIATTEGIEGNQANGPRVLEPTPIPQGVRLVVMGGLKPPDDLPTFIEFANPWAPPVAPHTEGAETTTNDTGTNRELRRNGGFLAHSHPISIDSLTRRPTRGDTSRPEADTAPTSMNDWIADRLGFDSSATPPRTRKVLHRTHGNGETPSVVTQRKTGSREQHRELNRFGVLTVFSDDVIMPQLPTMTSEPRTVSVPDAEGGTETITFRSLPVSMERIPDVPNKFNIKLTDRLTRSAGLIANRFKGFSVEFSAGVISRLPGDMVRLEMPAFRERFQKVWTRGRDRSDDVWDAHLFHSTDTAVYKVRRTIAVWMENDTSPTLFDFSTVEALTADDVRRIDEGRPNTNRIPETEDPFLDRAGGTTHLGGALVRDVTYPNGGDAGDPARPFFRDFAHRLLTEIDQEYPGLVLPHLAIPGTPKPETSHAGWRHRRNKSQARENTENFLAKVNAASFHSDPNAWLSGRFEVKLVETKKLPWRNEFRERRVFVPDHISVWPRVRFNGYSEATALDTSHTGTTTGSSSSLSRRAGKFTSLTNEGRVGVNVRSVHQGLDTFGHPSQSGGPTIRLASDFRHSKRSEHGISSATETNVKDKSGSRRLFANAEFSAWIGPRDGLVPRSSRAERVADPRMGREIFGDPGTAVSRPRAQVELHAPRVGRRVPLDSPPTTHGTPPRSLPPAEAHRLFGQGPEGFVNTAPPSTRVLPPTQYGLETVVEEAEPEEATPRTESRNPPRTTDGTTTTTNTPRDTEPPAGQQEGSGRRNNGNDTAVRPPQRDDGAPEPLAIQRTPLARLLADTFGTVQAFDSALFHRDGNVITVASLTFEAMDHDHWSFSRSVDSRDGSTAIVAAHVSSQTLAASPGFLRGTGDRFRTQLDDGLAWQRTRPTTVTWYVPTYVASAALRGSATLESNQTREVSFGSGLSHENTTTISIAARGVFNFQETAETPGQAQRGNDYPIVQPGLETRHTFHGHAEGESSSVSYRNRREVKFTGASFEFITGGVILQATEHKQDIDFIVTFPRSPGEHRHTGWQVPVRDAQKVMVPELWVFARGLVHDAITWRPDGTFELGTRPPPTAPPADLVTKPDLMGKGLDSRPLQVDSLLDRLNQRIRSDGWELTVNSREDVIKALNRHVSGNRIGLEVRVKPIGPRFHNHSRTATLNFDVQRGPSNVDHLGGLIEYVDRNITSTGDTQTNTKIRGNGTGGAFGLLGPIGNEHDPATGRDTGAISAGGTPAFRQQSRTEQSDSQGFARELTQERVLFSPYATVTTPTTVAATLTIGDRAYTEQVDDLRQESVYPLPYLETRATGDAPVPAPSYRPQETPFDVDTWSRNNRGQDGTGFQDGDGGLDAIPVAIQGEAKSLLDAAVVNTALLHGWTKPNERADTEVSNVASATRYLDRRFSDIDRAAGITARKDELLLQALTPDATHEPTVLAEFEKSVVKVRTLIDTGSARIEGVSNESRSRDSDQEGGRQSQGTTEQMAKNAGLGIEATQSGQSADRIRENLQSESADLSGARGGKSTGQRHGAEASGPGTKRMFLVRVPAVWAIWAEGEEGTATARGGHAEASILRWVDADQARAWGLTTESPQIKRYAQAEKRFSDADAAYFKARGKLFSFVGRFDAPEVRDNSRRRHHQNEYQRLEEEFGRTNTARNSAMRALVDALRDLRASQPAPATRGTPPTQTTGTGETSHSAPAPRGPSPDVDVDVNTDSAAPRTPPTAPGPAAENTGSRATTDSAPTTDHRQTRHTEPDRVPVAGLYDMPPHPTPADTPIDAPASRAPYANDDIDTITRATDPARNAPTAKDTRTPRTSDGRARESTAHETASSPAPARPPGQRDSDGVPRFPVQTEPAAHQEHPHAPVVPPPHTPGVPTATEGGETETVPTAEEPETTGEDRPSRQEELNAEFHGALNVPPNG
ncbi:hypothetical protein [Nocardiopsis sp. NPDC006832]|uniref:WXG100-like domain-containing protein n=1 Tax=Nocardiopsis sp. NPDC006832 TaxID=3157188 RepID=UPI00340447BD